MTAHFDDEGRFIHRCHCGAHAAFGYGVNLRADKLGTWYCGHTDQNPKTISPEQAPPALAIRQFYWRTPNRRKIKNDKSNDENRNANSTDTWR